MPLKNLTEKFVARVTWTPNPKNRPQDYFDVSQPNLLLSVGKKSKTFYWKGNLRSGKRTQLKIDRFPNVNLDEAREECREISRCVRQGKDPRRRGDEEEWLGEDLVRELTENNPFWATERSQARADMLAGYLERTFIPEFGDTPIREIHSGDMLNMVGAYTKAGKSGAAGHMHSALRAMWRFAVIKLKVDYNPMFDLPAPPAGDAGERYLTGDEIHTFWWRLGTTKRQETRHAILLRLLLALPFRGVEVAKAEWREINFEDREWIVPGGRVKSRRHNPGKFLMPLTETGIELLTLLKRDTGESRWLFPAPRKDSGPIEIKIIERYVARQRKNKGIFADMERWSKHDLRRTVSTHMGRLKVDEEIIERILNHKIGKLKRTYNLYQYADEKREAMNVWDKFLRKTVGERKDPYKISLRDVRPPFPTNDVSY